jgi:hypothetical protein
MVYTLEQDERDNDRHPVRVEVTVKTQRVVLTSHRLTDQINQEATVQGAAIQVDFQLSIEEGHRFRVVGMRCDQGFHVHRDLRCLDYTRAACQEHWNWRLARARTEATSCRPRADDQSPADLIKIGTSSTGTEGNERSQGHVPRGRDCEVG